MTDGEGPRPGKPGGGGLEARISAAQRRRDKGRGKARSSISGGAGGMAIGLRIATEMVAAIAICVGIGLALDSWLGTKPWLMLLFIVLGVVTAFYNVMRTAKELERRRKAETAQADSSAGGERRG
ncbi:MAG: AtpZ/AtpI family protein [Tistlia sp.]|uniref:AtpZ/AtpI family protein n=1 Tax=Tistlia sp. TaxID=3057121 RepID=UPI0034A49E97